VITTGPVKQVIKYIYIYIVDFYYPLKGGMKIRPDPDNIGVKQKDKIGTSTLRIDLPSWQERSNWEWRERLFTHRSSRKNNHEEGNYNQNNKLSGIYQFFRMEMGKDQMMTKFKRSSPCDQLTPLPPSYRLISVEIFSSRSPIWPHSRCRELDWG
jgi:hypothetical protein